MGQLDKVLSGEDFLLFDGGMGTMLQAKGIATGECPELLCLDDPQMISSIHREYVEAGSSAVTTNTFGANSRKLGAKASVDDVFAAAVKCARDAGARYVAADIGPLGDLIFPLGELSFSEAYELFAEQARAIAKTDADLVIIETMSDVLEMAAAVIAVQDVCNLPVFASMTFEASGRTFLGISPKEAALTLGLLNVDAMGVNCSAGPADLQPVVQEILGSFKRPVIVQANAGLPSIVDGNPTYDLMPADYARAVLPMVESGASVVGGCCGTNPDYIREVASLLESRDVQMRDIASDDIDAGVREVVDDEGRVGEIIEMILEADGDHEALRELFAEEYDLD